jgi:hypothetical protein
MKSFKTIKSAVNELDKLYGRDHWTSVHFVDEILIAGISTTVSCGLRMDPTHTCDYKYFHRCVANVKYTFANVRLS